MKGLSPQLGTGQNFLEKALKRQGGQECGKYYRVETYQPFATRALTKPTAEAAKCDKDISRPNPITQYSDWAPYLYSRICRIGQIR